jgi:hypothetical protein
MYVKKANGAVEQYKRELSAPELVLDAPDPETMLQNIMAVAAKKIVAIGNDTHHDGKDTKRLKDLYEITIGCIAYQQKTAQHDALAQLTEDELMAKVQRLAARNPT